MEKRQKLPVAPFQNPAKALQALLGHDMLGATEREINDAFTLGYAQGLMERPRRGVGIITGAFFGIIAGAAVTAAIILL